MNYFPIPQFLRGAKNQGSNRKFNTFSGLCPCVCGYGCGWGWGWEGLAWFSLPPFLPFKSWIRH